MSFPPLTNVFLAPLDKLGRTSLAKEQQHFVFKPTTKINIAVDLDLVASYIYRLIVYYRLS